MAAVSPMSEGQGGEGKSTVAGRRQVGHSPVKHCPDPGPTEREKEKNPPPGKKDGAGKPREGESERVS